MSINMGPLTGGKLNCELNNATDEMEFASSLKDEAHYTYLAIEVLGTSKEKEKFLLAAFRYFLNLVIEARPELQASALNFRLTTGPGFDEEFC